MKDWFASERGAYFFLLLGIGLIALFGALEYRFPKTEQLETACGRVLWQQETHGAMYFILSDKQQLVLYTKGDADLRQRQTIRDAELYPVSVKFYRQQKAGTGFAPGDFYIAYVVAVGGKEVASLDAVRSAYRRDNLTALVLGILATLAGIWRVRMLKFSPSPRRADDETPASRRSR